MPPHKAGRIISTVAAPYPGLYSAECSLRHLPIFLTLELLAGRRLLEPVIRRLPCGLLLVALEKHRSPLAFLPGIRSARILAATAEDNRAMLVVNMMTTPVMIVSSNSCTLRSAWRPMAAPPCAGVRVLVPPMHFPTMCCT